MALYGLDFVGDFSKYPEDAVPANYPEESTRTMRFSGDYAYAGAFVKNIHGTVTFNDVAYGPGSLGVANLDASGNPVPSAVAWEVTADYTLEWPAGGPNNFQIAAATGVTDPLPGGNPPGTTAGVGVYLTRAGTFFTAGQAVSHSESTGATYAGGALTVRVEVTRHGPWWVQVHGGGALLVTVCGDTWGGGELYAGRFGTGDPFGSGGVIQAVLITDSVSGATSTRIGDAECPHAPPVGAGRAWALWWPH